MQSIRTFVMRAFVVSFVAVLLTPATLYADDAKRLNDSRAVLSEMRNADDNGIPDSIWSKAECVVVIPDLKKAGFIVGGEAGSGVMACRNGGHWGAPIFMKMAKGSFGLQAGASSTDLVLVVMNRGGADKLLGNKVTLGADASVAAGPVGRSASAATDAQLTAQMLAYSRSKGVFAGINLSGGSLRPDDSANAKMYGAEHSARQIAFGTVPVRLTAEGRAFSTALGRDVRATGGIK
jgi:lipid-binding SYLF domain-containing protein